MVGRLLFAFLLAATMFPQSPQQQRDIKIVKMEGRKMALVVGNRAYRGVDPLKNPINDAQSIEAALREKGFEVSIETDLAYRPFAKAVGQFAARLKQGDLVVFYFAGHGLAINGQNYLVPVDFDASNESEAQMAAVQARWVQEEIERRSPRATIMILDACRNNPFVAARSLGNGGLARMNESRGSLILFAAKEGEIALDNPAETNGLFTKHLVQTIRESKLSIQHAARRLRERVAEESQGRQFVTWYDGLLGDLYFAEEDIPPPPVVPTQYSTQESERSEAEWNAIRTKLDSALFVSYLERNPNSPFSPLAKRTLDALRKWDVVKSAVEEKSIDAYLSEYPDSPYRAAAEARTAMIQRWKAASLRPSIAGLEEFLAAEPQDELFVSEARALLLRLREAAKAAELDAWQLAKQSSDPGIVRSFLDRYPASQFRAMAERHFAALAAWAAIKAAPTETLIAQFVATHPESIFASEGHRRLAGFREVARSAPTLGPKPGEIRTHGPSRLDYVWVPPGEAVLGCVTSDRKCKPAEKSNRGFRLEVGFWMTASEVDVKSYLLFAEATGTPLPRAPAFNRKWSKTDHPITQVSFADAERYCAWVSGRIPSSDEWEYAARGGTIERIFPWGEKMQPKVANFDGKQGRLEREEGTVSVRAYDPNGFGLYGMAGNAAEWVSVPNQPPIARGGSYYDQEDFLRISAIRSVERGVSYQDLGFRCVISAWSTGASPKE